MDDRRAALTRAIEHVRDSLLAEGLPDAAAINSGRCTCVVDDVVALLGGYDAFERLGMQEIGIDNLMVVDPDDELVLLGFDRDLLRRHWPNVRPPEGLEWDSLDAIADFADFSAGTHEWIVLDGRHYDAEAPGGVDNLFDLPFFGRIIATWRAEAPSDRGMTVRR